MKVRGVGVCSLEGPTHDNEDRFVHLWGEDAAALARDPSSSSTTTSTSTSSYPSAIFAVYDGHAGDRAVMHVQKTLHTRIFRPSNRSLFFPTSSSADEGEGMPDPSAVEEVILQSFRETEEEVLALNEAKDDISGACAVVVIHQGDRLYVANLGDSRALIGRKVVKGSFIGRLTLSKARGVEEIESLEKKKRVRLRVQNGSSFLRTLTQDKIRCKPIPLTRDLKAVAPYERERILAAGGWIRRGRVFGVLAPSRSFGDPLEKGRMRGRKIKRGTVKGGEGRKVEEEEKVVAQAALATGMKKEGEEGEDEEDQTQLGLPPLASPPQRRANGDAQNGADDESSSSSGEVEVEVEQTKEKKKKKKKQSNDSNVIREEDTSSSLGDEKAEDGTPDNAVKDSDGKQTQPASEAVVSNEDKPKEPEQKEEGKEENIEKAQDPTASPLTKPATAEPAGGKKDSGSPKVKKARRGKADMKQVKGVKEGVVIAVPEITLHTLAPEDDFLVLATDGLWDVMENKEVVDHVSAEVLKWRRMKEDEEAEASQEGGKDDENGLRQRSDMFLQEVCRGLCKRAKRRGSRDDITVIIVIFEAL